MPETTCSVEGCSHIARSRTFCSTHYTRWSKHGDPLTKLKHPGKSILLTAEENETGFRLCKTCEERKPLGDFPPGVRCRNGRVPNCGPCNSTLEAERYRKRRAKDVENRASGKWRDNYLRRTYGISSAGFDALAAAQNYSCAVCRRPEALVVDHCHERGAVRALLCNDCNLALGHVRDDTLVLSRLISYLEEHRIGGLG